MSGRAMPAGRRVGGRQLARLCLELSPRDWAVLHSVADYRYLSARQIERLHFPVGPHTPLSAARTARRVLERLSQQCVLARLERRVGGVRAGSAGFIYGLGRIGRRLLKGQGQAAREPSQHFLAHSLAVAELMVGLVEQARAGQLELVEIQTEPACWRPYLGAQGARTTLKPDLFTVVANGETEHHWFIEVDLGTEHRPALQRKCLSYLEYLQTGQEQAGNGLFPRVLWVVPDEARAAVLGEVTTSVQSAPPGLFAVVPMTAALPTLAGRGDEL